MKTYLIQRGKFEDRDYKKGLDSIVSLDYMGSAEFEWGALPQSLARIRDNVSEYAYVVFNIFEHPICVFFNRIIHNEVEEIRDYLYLLAGDTIRLKERSDFKPYVDPSKYDKEWQLKHAHKTDFWWDLDNDIMFWKENEVFETKFKSIISIKPI